MMTSRRAKSAAVLACALPSLLLSACTGGSGSDADDAPAEVSTDVGVGADDITLGVLADQTGPGAAMSEPVTQGGELWAAQVNADGGICGRDVVLDVQDTAGDPATASSAYASQSPEVLGYLQLSGAAVTAALAPALESDGLLAITDAPTSTALGSTSVLTLGATYDVQMINGLAWLAEQDQLADGAIIGHLHDDSAYGQDAVLGVTAYAEEHGLQVVDATVGAAETDMAAAMTSLQQQGVTAIALNVPPAAASSAAVQNKALGLDVPMLGGSDSISVAQLTDVTTTAAYTQVSFAQSFAPLSADVSAIATLASAYAEEYGGDPEPGVVDGYVAGLAWQQFLTTACESGDLTRASVLKAREGTKKLDTQVTSVAIDLSTGSEPTSRESLIVRTAVEETGKLVLASEPFASDEAQNYQVN